MYKNLLYSDDVINFNTYLSQNPQKAYELIDNQNPLEVSVQHKSFRCAMTLYNQIREDILTKKKMLPLAVQKKIFTNSLIGTVPYFYDAPSAYRLFDRMILECAQIVDLPIIYYAVSKQYGAEFCHCLEQKVKRHVSETQIVNKVLPLPNDYSL